MKKVITLFFLSILVFNLMAQLKLTSNGSVGIGNETPVAKLDVYGSSMRYEYSNRPLRFYLFALDPRIVSTNKVVFHNIDYSDWIDIECKMVHEESDSTLKENFLGISNSLDKIKSLNGYTFNWKSDEAETRHAGLVAQQVERVMPELVSKSDSTGKKLIAYSGIIPYLVEAIKEQQQQITTLQKVITEQEKEIITIKGQQTQPTELSLKNATSVEDISANEEGAILYQNSPNPFNQETEIKFFIPQEIATAKIYIHDLNGGQIKVYNINERNDGSLLIQGTELNKGMYTYTLVADGEIAGTKRMILTD